MSPPAYIGDDEYAFSTRSVQHSVPVFASRQLRTPPSDTMYTASPTTSGDGLCGTFFFAVHATCVLVTSPLPSGLIATSVGELYPVQTYTRPLANTGRGTTEYPLP